MPVVPLYSPPFSYSADIDPALRMASFVTALDCRPLVLPLGMLHGGSFLCCTTGSTLQQQLQSLRLEWLA